MLDSAHYDSEWFCPAIPISGLSAGNVSTETIDLNSLYPEDMSVTQSFDLSSIESTSLGRLLHALPMPAFLVDRFFHVIFANEACRKITANGQRIVGVRFVDLLPYPDDAGKARELTEKAQVLLESAFETRRPRRAEAILKIDQNKIWCRLHIRSVRLASERHLLVLIEDLTSERTQQRLSQREEARLRNANQDIERTLRQRTTELQLAKEKVRDEENRHDRTLQELENERKRFQELFHSAPVGLILVASDGTIRDVNAKFTELFGHDREDLPVLAEWFASIFQMTPPESPADGAAGSAAASVSEPTARPVTWTARSMDGTKKKVRISTMTLITGDYLMTCIEVPANGQGA